VKEVLQSLVDDGLVSADKIGSSNFFWSFPSQHGAVMQSRLDKVKDISTTSEIQLAEIRAAIVAEMTARPESDDRVQALERLTAAKNELHCLEKVLGAYGACDPVKIEEMKRGGILAHEATIRWTDNLSILTSYITKQNGTDPGEIRKYLEIGDDYEDIC